MVRRKKIIISILCFLEIYSVTIYQCSNSEFLSDQCMFNWTDKNGNTHISFKKCPDDKICQPIKDYSMGFCVSNFKFAYPGEECKRASQCSSKICQETCKGLDFKEYCIPKKKVCDFNLSCRKKFDEDEQRIVYRCLNLSDINEDCEENDDCELNLVCAWNKDIGKDIKVSKIEDIKNYITMNEYLNITKNKTCINRASLKNGIISNEPMACESGDLIHVELYQGIKEYFCASKIKIVKDCDFNYKCTVEADVGYFGKIHLEEECVSSNLGNLVCPLNQKENAWKIYLEKYEEIFKKNKINKKREKEEIHIPYNKDTLKSPELSEYFWEYYDWIHNLDADECTKQYFFVNNQYKSINYSIYLLYIYFLFLY